MIDHAVPEELRRNPVGGITCDFMGPRGTDQFGNLGIGMFAWKDFLAAGERIDDRLVITAMS